MLGKEGQGIDDQVLLRQPDGAAFRHTELRAHDANVHVGQLMRIVNVRRAARARDFRHG